MKRIFFLVLPQALLVPLGFVIGLACGVVENAGGWATALSQASGGSWGAGPGHVSGHISGHIGAPALVILAAVWAIFLLGIVSSMTSAGLVAGLMGAMYGFVFACLVDWLWLFPRKLTPYDIESIKRWAGRGALAIAIFTVWVAFFNPIREVMGIFAVTGTFVCLACGGWGLVRWIWARRG